MLYTRRCSSVAIESTGLAERRFKKLIYSVLFSLRSLCPVSGHGRTADSEHYTICRYDGMNIKITINNEIG